MSSAGALASTRYLTGTGGAPRRHANTPRMLLFSRNTTAQLHVTLVRPKHGLCRVTTCHNATLLYGDITTHRNHNYFHYKQSEKVFCIITHYYLDIGVLSIKFPQHKVTGEIDAEVPENKFTFCYYCYNSLNINNNIIVIDCYSNIR